MPVRKRNLSRSTLTPHETAWLRGDHNCGFVEFKRDEELQALWAAHGDPSVATWDRGKYSKPEAIAPTGKN